MDKKIEIFNKGIYLVGIGQIGIILFYNNYKKGMLLLCLALIVLWFIEAKYTNENKTKLTYLLWAMEYIVIQGICFQEQTGMSVLLNLMLIGNIVFSSTFRESLIMTIVAYLGYIITMRLSHGNEYNFYAILTATVNFGVTYLLVSAIQYQMLQKEKAKEYSNELLIKTIELEKAYEKLQEFYEKQEEITLLQERNRIAGEIHDTVGHRLTTAIVQLEASKRLLNRDIDKAVEKLTIAQTQVREGLQDIRQAVRVMKECEEKPLFKERVKTFVDELSKNSDVYIESNIGELPKFSSKIENILFRSMQEGFTNGIRHGKSKYFYLQLCAEDNYIKLVLEDKGIGCENLVFGFGLNNMERNIKELEGSFDFSYKNREGTKLIIKIPVGGDQ